MNDLSHRLALAALVISGLLTAGMPWAAPEAAAMPLVLHRQIMVALLGLGLVLAAFVPSLRLPAIAAAVLSKSSYVVLGVLAVQPRAPGASALATEAILCLALLSAGAIFLRTARQEARWDGMLPLHPGA